MWERDVAIEQLKKLGYGLGQKIESSGDAVSRQAVHETIEKWAGSMSVLIALPTREVRPLLDSIHKLPSVKPQEPSITWVTGADGAKIAFKDVPVWKVTKICEILGEPQERSE